MCLDWNSCQEKTQPPHAGLGSYANTYILSLVCYCSFTFWATQSDGFRLRFCRQHQQHSQLQIFHVFFLTDLGPLSSRCQPINHWMAPKKLTWKSNLGSVELGMHQRIFCKFNDVFFIIQTVAEVSLKVFFSSKKTCQTVQQFQGQKVRVRFLEEELSKGHVQWQFVFNPLRPPSFIGPDKFEGLWTPSLELQELQGAAAGGPGMKLMVGESLGGWCFRRNDIAGCILLSCGIMNDSFGETVYMLKFSKRLFRKFICCFFADWRASLSAFVLLFSWKTPHNLCQEDFNVGLQPKKPTNYN